MCIIYSIIGCFLINMASDRHKYGKEANIGNLEIRKSGRVGQTGKTTMIRRITVREDGVSRHHRGVIEGPPETPQTSRHYRIKGCEGAPELGSQFAERLPP